MATTYTPAAPVDIDREFTNLLRSPFVGQQRLRCSKRLALQANTMTAVASLGIGQHRLRPGLQKPAQAFVFCHLSIGRRCPTTMMWRVAA
jgi:hypothetical protein